MCKRCGESVDHLLLHCPIAYEMWSMIFCLFGICWVMPQRVVDLLDCWSCNFGRHCNIVIWRIVLIKKKLYGGLCRIVWRGVSGGSGILEVLRVANGSFLSLSLFFFFTLLKWCFVLPTFSCVSLPVLLDLCNLVSWYFCLFCTFPMYGPVFF